MAGFRAQIQARADPPQRDMPDDHLPDPDDTADFELPDQQTLIDAFTAGLSKESQHDFRSLSALLATLPDPVMDMSRLSPLPRQESEVSYPKLPTRLFKRSVSPK